MRALRRPLSLGELEASGGAYVRVFADRVYSAAIVTIWRRVAAIRIDVGRRSADNHAGKVE